jgi:hypothetical protein
MGIEGHESPRDVASDKQKHPWEIFPTDESSANLSEKEREQLKKKKDNKAKHKMQLSKTKKWVNTHRILLLSIVIAVVILAAGGIVAYYKIQEKNIEKDKPVAEDDGTPLILYGFPEDFNIEKAFTAQQAYQYAAYIADEVAVEGIEDPYSDTTKVEDNMSLFVENLKSDYEKLYFRIYTTILISRYENPTRAKYLLEKIEQENHQLDKNQRYVYCMAYEEYYYVLGDTENFDNWRTRVAEDAEFVEDTFVYVDEQTGEPARNEEVIAKVKETIRKEKEEREKNK